jgi:uncharacterized protein (UPF0332 family)
MAYHDDLLDLAFELIGKDRTTQADLRRAVSTAYYALFHLLVSETTLSWSRDSSRNALGRMFDHGLMKRVSDRVADDKKTPFAGEDAGAVSGLRLVAKLFVELQDLRRTADYDNGTSWTRLDAIVPIASAKSAFVAWDDIKHTDIAQDYLVSLLIRPRD